MPLLADYAITPDVFDVTSYSGDEVCRLNIRALKDILLIEGLVRDLRDGEWGELFSNNDRTWHRWAKELLKNLVKKGRLVPFEATLPESPENDRDWCSEAIGTHEILPLIGGVIVTESVKEAFSTDQIVGSIDKLPNSAWWKDRSSSVSLARSLDEYRQQLAPVLRCANSIMFIDPYLYPGQQGYRRFGDLLEDIAGRTPVPAIEIHRVCWEVSSDKRGDEDFMKRLERGFTTALQATVRAVALQVDVFLWDDFHDRFVISNLVGISVPHGFDTTGDPNSVTRWARLGRKDCEDIQREFDPASNRHKLVRRFKIS